VLDLGSGSGLVAVAAVLAGAERVTASEVDPFGQAAIAVNAEGNGVAGISVVGDVLDADPPCDGLFFHDVVLAGDVCYDRAMTERVLPFLDRAAAAGGTVLLGDPGRPYLPRPRLRQLATYEIPDGDGGGPRETTVWQWLAGS
jgi:predicted nicotinamide N-methyase